MVVVLMNGVRRRQFFGETVRGRPNNPSAIRRRDGIPGNSRAAGNVERDRSRGVGMVWENLFDLPIMTGLDGAALAAWRREDRGVSTGRRVASSVPAVGARPPMI